MVSENRRRCWLSLGLQDLHKLAEGNGSRTHPPPLGDTTVLKTVNSTGHHAPPAIRSHPKLSIRESDTVWVRVKSGENCQFQYL